MSKRKTERGRFSSRKKAEVVVRLLRGEDLDVLSREFKITAHRLPSWRDDFLAGGQANLKARQSEARDDELKGLKAMLGDLTMRLEASREAVRRRKQGEPLASGGSKS